MKKALVLGLGTSGRAAAKFLMAKGWQVFAAEKNGELLSSSEIVELTKSGLTAFQEEQPFKESFDLLVPSPGISPEHPLYKLALTRGVEVVGEAELAFRHMPNRAVAITGTNGKTTVTLLTEHILKKSGRKAKALGNVGEPLTTHFLESDPEEIVVAELSSFQLETMSSAVFDAAVVLNVTPDHLDRYKDMREYAKAKCRLQKCVKPGAPFYVHQQIAAEFADCLEQGFRTFGPNATAQFWTDRTKGYEGEKVEYMLPVRYRESGEHERENALAAWLLVREFGITAEEFIWALASFRRPPHRIEFVTSIEGVSYFDDSKGTNLDAVIQAVKTMQGPIILIAGGVDKGASYAPWLPVFKDRVKKVLVLGQAASKIEKEIGSFFGVERVHSLSEAVNRAHRLAKKGDCVLLSPGCSSFDMFRDYAHRGKEFKRFVQDLEERSKKYDP